MNTGKYESHLRGGADFGPVCLVTGAAGFLGGELVSALVRRGYEVRALDNRPLSGPRGVKNVRAFTGDIRDYGSVLEAARGCDTVFHTAAIMNLVGFCGKSARKETFDINHGGTLNVVRACREAGVPRLVHTSTNTVCYDPGPVRDGDESRPYAGKYLDIYGESKMLGEKAVLEADGKDGLRTVAIRPAGVWGAGDGCYMLRRMVEQVAAGKLVATIGDGSSLADNTHVVNLVLAEFLAAGRLAENPDSVGGKAYFVTDEEQMNLWDWFAPLINGLGRRVPDRKIPAGLMYAVAWVSEMIHKFGGPRPVMSRLEVHNVTTTFTFRTDRARSELGYRPLVGQAEGMKELLPWCREIMREACGG